MLQDLKWLESVLKLPLKPALAAALASSGMLYADWLGLLPLDAAGWAEIPIRAVLTISAILAWVLVIVHLADLLLAPVQEQFKQSALKKRRAAKKAEQEADLELRREKTLLHLDHLSKQEVLRVTQCLEDGSPSFYAYVYSPEITLLQGKGLVWTPGGTHNEDQYPFSFHTFAWEAILARQSDFTAKAEEIIAAESGRPRRGIGKAHDAY